MLVYLVLVLLDPRAFPDSKEKRAYLDCLEKLEMLEGQVTTEFEVNILYAANCLHKKLLEQKIGLLYCS